MFKTLDNTPHQVMLLHSCCILQPTDTVTANPRASHPPSLLSSLPPTLQVFIRPNKVVYLPTTFMEEHFNTACLPVNCEMLVEADHSLQPERHTVTIKAVPRQVGAGGTGTHVPMCASTLATLRMLACHHAHDLIITTKRMQYPHTNCIACIACRVCPRCTA